MFNDRVDEIITCCNRERKEVYNILLFPINIKTEKKLCSTGHNFYRVSNDNSDKWESSHGDIPENYYQFSPNTIDTSIEFDVCVIGKTNLDDKTVQNIINIARCPILVMDEIIDRESNGDTKGILFAENVEENNFLEYWKELFKKAYEVKNETVY